MTESEFNQRVDDILVRIEDAVDASGADVDYETAAGILTLSFADGSKLIVNRQTPLRQIWVATRAGGFHYDYDAERDLWVRDSDAEELFAGLSAHCTAQAGEPVELG